MNITLHNCSKRYNYDWIFRNINYTFTTGKSYAITGPNGSGKSTLLKVISGQLSPSEGKIEYAHENNKIAAGEIFRHLVYSAPYIESINDFTLIEFLQFHFSFKKTTDALSVNEIIDLTGLAKHRNKTLKTFSSGMRQRIRLISSIAADTSILLLDEPTTNLDGEGVAWYSKMIEKFNRNRVIIIGSNMEREYGFVSDILNISEYK